MESFSIFILIVVVVVLLLRKQGGDPRIGMLLDKLQGLIDEISLLKEEVNQMRREVSNGAHEPTQPTGQKTSVIADYKQEYLSKFQKKPSPEAETNLEIPPTIAQPPTSVEAPVVQEFDATAVKQPTVNDQPALPFIEKPIEEAIFIVLPKKEASVEPEPINAPMAAFSEPGKVPPREPLFEEPEGTVEKWLRNNPDLEKFIGENLINKIGIAVLVLGIAFFVKYAIDQNWINEVGRVCIGLGCGALLVGLAHFMRNSYRSFSSVLAGGGIAVFYFTIAFAFHQYHLMSQAAAFIIMVVITAFAMALSVLYNKLELAIIASVGGFVTPFLVSTGEGNYQILFTYLIILNIGILLLSYFKRWPAINIIALFFTEIIFGGWLGTTLNDQAKLFSHPVALGFATAFYFIFLGTNMLNQIKNREQFKPFDFIILLFISSTYFGAGICLLHTWGNGAYQGLFTLGLGMVNLGLTYFVYKNGKADRNLLFLLIGITLTFITLTIPIQLHGHAITLFWSAEFVLLYWLSEYSGIRLFKISSVIICFLAFSSLLLDWQHASQTSATGLTVIFTNLQGIVTNLVAIAAFFAWYFLLRKNREGETVGIENGAMARMALRVAVGLLFITCIFGVNLYFRQSPDYVIPNVYHRMITEIFALVMVILMQRRKGSTSPWLELVPMAICFVVMIGSADCITSLRNEVLDGKASWGHLCGHWVDSIMLGVLIYMAIQSVRTNQEAFDNLLKAISVAFVVIVLTLLSIELLHMYVIAAHRNSNIAELQDQFSKAGLTVIWALCSFALMWLGMRHGQKVLRIISLALFTIVLLKLFISDISDISEGGKILAFILLGIILLTVSFMYQKLKKIIIDDKEKE